MLKNAEIRETPNEYQRSWTDCFQVDPGDSTANNTQETTIEEGGETKAHDEMDVEEGDFDEGWHADRDSQLSGTQNMLPHHFSHQNMLPHHFLTVLLHRREARCYGDIPSFRCRLAYQDIE